MNKSELVKKVADRTGLSQTDSNGAVDAVFEEILESLKNGNNAEFTGFGSFKVSKRAERTGRHPQTGAAIKIPASKGVKFTVSKRLKDAVNV